MKRIITFTSSAMLLLMGLCTSCQKDLGSPDEKGAAVSEVVVRATIAGNGTKVSFTEDGSTLKTAWESDDHIIGWDAAGNAIELAVASINNGTAIFKTVSGSAAIPASGKVYMIYAPGKSYSNITIGSDGKGTLVYDLSNQNLNKVPALMTATGEVEAGVLNLSFINRLAIVAVKNPKFPASAANKTITGLKLSGTNILTTATFSVDDKALKMESSGLGGAITKACNFTTGTDGNTNTMVYFAVLPNKTQADVTISTTNPTGYQIECTGKTFTAGNCYLLANTVCLPAGALPGVFSVSATKKVHFSQGNLYYDGTNWGFETEQYYFRTYDGKGKCDAGGYNKDSGTTSDHWGLFGWVGASTKRLTSSSGIYGVSISTIDGDYGNVLGEALKADWGTAIDDKGTWTTLTGGENGEWKYLFDNHVHVWGTCNNVPGRFIAPDGFEEDADALSTVVSDWAKAQADGIVFLPAAGYRYGSNVFEVGGVGFYWSSTASDIFSDSACLVDFDSRRVDYEYFGVYRCYGHSVRLITESN